MKQVDKMNVLYRAMHGDQEATIAAMIGSIFVRRAHDKSGRP